MKYCANRAMGYGGTERLPGEVFEREFLRWDARLVELGYVRELQDEQLTNVRHCDECGREFISEGSYQSHLRGHVQIALPAMPVPKLEDEYPGGITIDDPMTGRMRARR